MLSLPDLAGYRIAQCYWVQLVHPHISMPALVEDTYDLFVCDGTAFEFAALLNCYMRGAASIAARLITATDFEKMENTPHTRPLFIWMPGPVGDGISSDDFAKNLEWELNSVKSLGPKGSKN